MLIKYLKIKIKNSDWFGWLSDYLNLKFIIYAIRWQIPSFLIYFPLVKCFGKLIGNILAGCVGCLIFYFVDKRLLNKQEKP